MTNILSKKTILGLLATCITAIPAYSQDSLTHIDESHKHPIEEIIVSGTDPMGRGRDSIAQGVAVITADELDRYRSASLGDILDHMPGMSQSSFGPVASRPVIRGLGGDRIRILIAGIGSIDASSSSPDHSVAIDPETAESIEVLRGPATLLFGNNAVGGVVNIYDGRIPTIHSDEFSGSFRGTYGSNGDQFNGSLWLTVPVNEKIVLHIDAGGADMDNMEVPGFVESQRLRDSEVDEAGPAMEESFGIVENTDSTKKSGAIGASYIGPKGMFGLSISRFETNYGVPGHAHAAPAVGVPETFTRIDLSQTRLDLSTEWHNEDGLIDLIRGRFGYADYSHQELEGSEKGTLFLNKGWEGRVEARLLQDTAWTTAMGVQARHRDFSAIGEEAIVAPNITNQIGAFFLESWENNDFTVDFGLRLENQKLTARSVNFEKSNTGLSASVSTIYTFSEDWRLALNAFRTQRAPNAEELLSNGPHLATRSYELGDLTLGSETALGGEISLRHLEGPITGSMTFFYTDYNDFIYQKLGEIFIEDMPVAQHSATDARFYGLEAEMQLPAYEINGGELIVTLGYDMVKADNVITNTPLPRIPPMSFNVGLDWTSDKLDVNLTSTFSAKQTAISVSELETDGFNDTKLSFTYRPRGIDSPFSIDLQVRNLFNAEIRHHTSFLKDLLPERGRDVKVTLRANF